MVAKGATEALRWLAVRGFLAWDAAAVQWTAQPLGRAAAGAHLEPDRATKTIEAGLHHIHHIAVVHRYNIISSSHGGSSGG